MRRRHVLAATCGLLAGCGGGGDAADGEGLDVFVGSSAAGATPPDQYTPDHASFGFSDYCAVSVNASRARFTRPIVDGQGLESVNPAARVRFVTNAASLVINLQYTNLSLLSAYNGTGLVLANGSVVATFTRGAGAAGPLAVLVSLGSVSSRTIEILMPYAASVDFIGVSLPAGSTFSAPAARPATRYVAGGDSITQGFFASGIAAQWTHALAVAKGYQLINNGYGGRPCVASDGTALANLTPSVASYLIGYNDFAAQVPLATFKANFTAFVNAFRAVNPTVKLYCITPLYTTTVLPLTIAQYRTQISDALTTLGNALNVLVDGAALMTNSSDRLSDGIHPNDLGSSEIVTAMTSILVT